MPTSAYEIMRKALQVTDKITVFTIDTRFTEFTPRKRQEPSENNFYPAPAIRPKREPLVFLQDSIKEHP